MRRFLFKLKLMPKQKRNDEVTHEQQGCYHGRYKTKRERKSFGLQLYHRSEKNRYRYRFRYGTEFVEQRGYVKKKPCRNKNGAGCKEHKHVPVPYQRKARLARCRD